METKISLMHCILPLLITGIPLLLLYFKILLSVKPSSLLLKSSAILLILFNLYGWTVFIAFGYIRNGILFATFRESLFFVALLISTLQMVGSWFASTQKNALFALTLSMATLGTTLILPEKYYTGEFYTSWFTIHLLLSLCSYTFFSVASVLSVMYLILNKKLKEKKFDTLFKNLPPLNKIEAYTALWLSLGVLFSLFSIVSVAIWNYASPVLENSNSEKYLILIPISAFAVQSILKFKQKISGRNFAFLNLGLYVTLSLFQLLVSYK